MHIIVNSTPRLTMLNWMLVTGHR